MTAVCPICLESFTDPVLLREDRRSYCRGCINGHFATRRSSGRNLTSPLTNVPVSDPPLLLTNNDLRTVVDAAGAAENQSTLAPADSPNLMGDGGLLPPPQASLPPAHPTPLDGSV